MDFAEAVRTVNEILNEEQKRPTVSYTPVNFPGDSGLASVAAALRFAMIQEKRPREIKKPPFPCQFESTNYNLLCALLGQVPPGSRGSLVIYVANRAGTPPGCAQGRRRPTASWISCTSELPLVAEFCVRQGAFQSLRIVLLEAALMPGHVMLLKQLEDMIALNYTLLTSEQYEELKSALMLLRDKALGQLDGMKDGRKQFTVAWPEMPTVDLRRQNQEIADACDALIEQCAEARHVYLGASLLEGLNLEVNQDKAAVENRLQAFGFSKALSDCLDEADRLYRAPGTAFDLKSSMGHLRSFMENVHAEALPAIAKSGEASPRKWGEGLLFLRRHDILSPHEEQFAAALYKLISDEAVHPLIADRECARLARNVVIEYGLLFLRKLEKLGIRRLPAKGGAASV